MRRRPPMPGFEEPAEPYEPAPPLSIEVYLNIHRQVIAAHDRRCVATGEHFEAAWENLPVVAIKPREMGGSLHVNNALPLCIDAAREFAMGHFTFGVDNELIVDLSRISPGLLQRLNPEGRLIAAADPAFHPDPDNIRFHRERIFLAVSA